MAITIVRECFGRRFTSSANGNETAIRVYLCWADSNYTDLDDVLADAITAGLPDLNDIYSASSSDLIVVRHAPTEMDKEKDLYKIIVEYASDDYRYNFPTSIPWEISVSSVLQEYEANTTEFDTTGLVAGNLLAVTANQPPLNAAGLPFDPPPMDFKGLVRINLRKRVNEYTDFGTISSWNELFGYVNSCNDDAISIAEISGAKYTMWMENIAASNLKQNGATYYDVTFSIIYDPQYHYQRILNAGYHDKNREMITLKNGEPVSQPWPLDAAGDPIGGDAINRKINARYFAFGFKEDKDWSVIGLPTLW